MIAALKVGQRIHVWPRPGLRVPTHAGIPGRFLPVEGAEVEWSAWWARRVGDGSALLTDPSVATRPEAPKPAPAEAEPPQGDVQ
jgi:hypothetical protein